MSTENEEHGFLHLPHRKKHEHPEHDTAGADEFVEIRESSEPWDPDRPLIREDEQYEHLSEPETYPSEGIPGPGGARAASTLIRFDRIIEPRSLAGAACDQATEGLFL